MKACKKFFIAVLAFTLAFFPLMDLAAVAFTSDLPPVPRKSQPQNQQKKNEQKKSSQSAKKNTNTGKKKSTLTSTSKSTQKAQPKKQQEPELLEPYKEPVPNPATKKQEEVAPKPFDPEEAILKTEYHLGVEDDKDSGFAMFLYDRKENPKFKFPFMFDSNNGGIRIDVTAIDHSALNKYKLSRWRRIEEETVRFLIPEGMKLFTRSRGLEALNNKDSIQTSETAKVFKSGTVVTGMLKNFLYDATLRFEPSEVEGGEELFDKLLMTSDIVYKVPQLTKPATLSLYVMDFEGLYKPMTQQVKGGETIRTTITYALLCRAEIYLDNELVWWKGFNLDIRKFKFN